MILTCPQCESRFALDRALLLPEGKKVRCSECKHEWFQEPEEDNDEAANSEEPEEESAEEEAGPAIELQDSENSDEAGDEPVDTDEPEYDENEGMDITSIPSGVMPAPEEPEVEPITSLKAAKKARRLAFSCAGLIFVLICAAVIVFQPAITSAWSPSLTLYNALGMGPEVPGEDLVFDRVNAAMQDGQLTVEGRVINLSSKDKALPRVMVLIKGSDDTILNRFIVPFETNMISAESMEEFRSAVQGLPDGAEQVSFRFAFPEE